MKPKLGKIVPKWMLITEVAMIWSLEFRMKKAKHRQQSPIGGYVAIHDVVGEAELTIHVNRGINQIQLKRGVWLLPQALFQPPRRQKQRKALRMSAVLLQGMIWV